MPFSFPDGTIKCIFEDGDEERNIGNMAKWRDAVNNIDVVDRKVLCPFSCSTSAIDAGKIEFDIMA